MPTVDSPRWALSANRLVPRRWQFWEPEGTRYLTEPQVTAQFAPTPIKFQQPGGWAFQQPGGGWLASARQRLSELADLKPNWDEASARPVAPFLINTVWNFLASELVSRLEVQPDIVPTFDGGLLIEWHTTAVDLIIESSPDGLGSFYFCDNETDDEVEAAVGDRLDAVSAAFVKLGLRL